MKKQDKKGFTLMEMLIVVAIIAILIAVSIPMFTAKLRDAKEAVCAANCRSLKALLALEYMTEDSEDAVRQIYETKRSEYACPLGGTISYMIEDGSIVVYCTHETGKNPLSDADKMQNLRDKLSGLNKTNTIYNNNSSDANKQKISDALREVGVDLSSLTSWALLYNNGGYPKLYWTDKDVSSITNGTAYAMAYTLTTGHYTVWKVNVKNGVITGEVNNSLQTPNVADQTYDKALEKYNELVK